MCGARGGLVVGGGAGGGMENGKFNTRTRDVDKK